MKQRPSRYDCGQRGIFEWPGPPCHEEAMWQPDSVCLSLTVQNGLVKATDRSEFRKDLTADKSVDLRTVDTSSADTYVQRVSVSAQTGVAMEREFMHSTKGLGLLADTTRPGWGESSPQQLRQVSAWEASSRLRPGHGLGRI